MTEATSLRPTSYDVARTAGVSQSTVSRCFNPASPISQETRARVHRAAEQLGYTPNAIARSLILRRSGIVGVIATKLTIRNSPQMVYAIGDALAGAGRRLLLITVEDDAAVPATLPSALEFPLDGLVACASLTAAEVGRFARRGVPVVMLNRDAPSDAADSVQTDHAAAARQLASLFYGAGHRHFLCIGGPEAAPVSVARLGAFTDRLRTLGVSTIASVATDFSYASGHRALLHHAGTASLPDAVFCANDTLALGAIDAARHALGRSVPDDVSITGFDDIEEAARAAYALTTVRQPVEDMVAAAVDLLLRRAAQPAAPPQRIRLPAELKLRGSARL